jgi:hypothetical protein
MGSTLRHFHDSGFAGAHPLTLIFLVIAMLLLFSACKLAPVRAATLAVAVLVLCDLPWEQSLVKREAWLVPLFQATLGRDEL